MKSLVAAIQSRRFWLISLLVIVSAIFVFRTAHHVPRLTHGFAMYYAYARFVIEGGSFSRAYDQQIFDASLSGDGFGDIKDIPNNPPTAALYILPFAWLTPIAAKIAWSALSLLFLFLSLRILFRVFEIPPGSDSGIACLILVFALTPLNDNLLYGQVYTFLLYLFCLSLEGLHKRQNIVSGLPISASTIFKGYGILLIAWHLLRRDWKPFAIALGGICAAALLLLPIFPPDAWAAFFQTRATSLGRNPSDAAVAYQTLNSFVRHLCTADPRWSPSPILNLPSGITTAVSAFVNLGFITLVFLKSFAREEKLELTFARLVCLGVVTAPVAEEYHYLLLVILMLAMNDRLHRLVGSWEKIQLPDVLFLAGTIVVAAPIPYAELNSAPFPTSLAAYPKLYAAILLILVSFTRGPESTASTR